MEIIVSKTNKYIKLCRSLQEKKYRKQNNMCILEGIKIVREAKKNGYRLLYIFATEDIDNIKSEFDCEVICVTSDIIQYISTTVTPQNVVGIAECKSWDFELPKTNYIVLDNLQDPSNIGAILRTASATNFCTIYTLNCVDIYSPKVIRSSMGNIFRCKVMNISESDIDLLKDNLYICDMSGKNIFNILTFSKIVGLCIGNEGHGVSEKLKEKIDNTISIPMDNDVESLNASVSAGIIMYHIKVNQKEIL